MPVDVFFLRLILAFAADRRSGPKPVSPFAPGQKVDGHVQEKTGGAPEYESVSAVQGGRIDESYGQRREADSRGWKH